MQLRMWGVGVALLSVSTAALADPLKTDWSLVETVQPGERVMVRLYEDGASREGRAIKGHFASATAEDITLVPSDGNSRTIAKKAVRRVAVQRPAKKRVVAALIGAGIVAAISLGVAAGLRVSEDRGNFFLSSTTLFGTIVGLAAGFGEPRVVIYNLPPPHRQP